MPLAQDLHAAWIDALRHVDTVLDAASAHEQKSTNAIVQRMRGRSVALNGAKLVVDSPTGSYCGGDSIADARLLLGDGTHVLVESKWYWKSYWVDRRSPSKARTYLLAPLEGRDSKSAVLDLVKLARLRDGHDAATHAALVLVAHCRPEHGASADLDEFAVRASVDHAPWESAGGGDLRWPSTRWTGYEYDVRVFTCRVDALDGWWSRFEPELSARG